MLSCLTPALIVVHRMGLSALRHPARAGGHALFSGHCLMLIGGANAPTSRPIPPSLGVALAAGRAVRQLRHDFGPSLARLSAPASPDSRSGRCSTSPPCLLDADWCLRSDVMTDSRQQARRHAHVRRGLPKAPRQRRQRRHRCGVRRQMRVELEAQPSPASPTHPHPHHPCRSVPPQRHHSSTTAAS